MAHVIDPIQEALRMRAQTSLKLKTRETSIQVGSQNAKQRLINKQKEKAKSKQSNPIQMSHSKKDTVSSFEHALKEIESNISMFRANISRTNSNVK
jgi:hypothetical protein